MIRLASVSYLNSRPLIHGLDRDPRISLQLHVPAKLAGCLSDGSADVVLLPTIDYQRLPNLRIVPAGGIGCDGPTHTVRLFARRPIEHIRSLACDTHSHTSVALARIILAERYDLRPEVITLDNAANRDDEARLLIGDKVVCQEPTGFEHQYDLGLEWKELTGLPFVFAVWTARGGVELGDLPMRLESAKRAGLKNAPEIVQRYAVPMGWPAQLALDYLTKLLKYDIGPQQLHAIEHFHHLAAKHKIIVAARPLSVYA